VAGVTAIACTGVTAGQVCYCTATSVEASVTCGSATLSTTIDEVSGVVMAGGFCVLNAPSNSPTQTVGLLSPKYLTTSFSAFNCGPGVTAFDDLATQVAGPPNVAVDWVPSDEATCCVDACVGTPCSTTTAPTCKMLPLTSCSTASGLQVCVYPNAPNGQNCGGTNTCQGGVCTPPSATTDPVIHGPDGEDFKFYGKPNGIYTLFSSPQFVVNMLLMPDGPEARFITKVGVKFGNTTVVLDTVYRQDYAQVLSKQLAPLGRVSAPTSFSYVVDLCRGMKINVAQMQMALSGLRKEPFYYLDVSFDVPGCHDDFGGVLGQLYRCKYESKAETFVWDPTTEESYRVEALDSAFGLFASKTVCPAPSQYGRKK